MLPTVVQVRSVRPAPPRKPEAIADPKAEEFFERFLRNRGTAGGVPAPRSIGSGVVIDGEGYVLTAAHLVEAGDSLYVRLADGRTLAATLVGKDRRGGIALLKIPARNLAAAVPGNPRRLRLAERVLALGAMPAGTPAVTDGIVSALESEEGDATGYLQTTAALHPSMGGGPLFNLAGEFVGVNAMLYSRVSGGSLSYAVPGDEALAIAKELRASGRVRRAALGITVAEVTPEAAALYGMDGPAGAYVQAVEPGGAAAKAGIAQGDVLLVLNGEPLRSDRHATRMVMKLRPGDTVTLRVRRKADARDEELRVTLGEYTD